MNNFKLLAEQEKMDSKAPPDRLRSKLQGTLGLIGLFGQMVELFLPKMLGMFRDLLGGVQEEEIKKTALTRRFEDKEKPKYPNQPL